MKKFIQSNWREILALILVIPLLHVGLLALGNPSVSESGPLSSLASLLVSLIGGVVKFAACLALAWAGLMVTFPEANRFIVGSEFDDFWNGMPPKSRMIASLIATGVLANVAALCMASS